MVRHANAALVAGLIRESGPLTRADLIRLSGLTRPTIMAIVDTLLLDNIVVEAGTRAPADAARGGRPGLLLSFNDGQRSVAVCRFRRDGVHLSLHDTQGTILFETRADLDVRSPRFLTTVASQITRAVRTVDDAGPLAAVSVLSPGLINRRTGACMSFAPWGWTDLPVRDQLQRRLGVPVSVLNPAAAAVLGEVAGGAGVGCDDVVLVFLDWGIGAGIVTGGRLVSGAHGAVGELGHCRVGRSSARCPCGQIGCLETTSSGRVILERTAGLHSATPRTLAGLAALDSRRIDRVLSEAADELGTAASWLVNLLNPSLVLLGGTEFAAGATGFLDRFADSVTAKSVGTNGASLTFGLAGAQADRQGAVRAALELLPERIRPRLQLSA